MGTHFRKRGEREKRRPPGTWTRPLLRSEEQAFGLVGGPSFQEKEEEEKERMLSPGMGGGGQYVWVSAACHLVFHMDAAILEESPSLNLLLCWILKKALSGLKRT